MSTEDITRVIDSNEVTIIDVRPIDAYNGWTMQDEPRGGHIKSAKSLPSKWANYLDWIEIVRSKNISPDDKIVLYGYTSDEIDKVAKLLSEAGYKNINVYSHFVDEWTANPELPMEHLEE